MSLIVQAVHKVGGHFPLLQPIKSISKHVRCNQSVYELYLNKRPCQLFRSIDLCFSALDKKTQATLAFSCSSAEGDAQHCRRCSAPNKTELLAPASPPMMFLKNILIDTAIRRDKSQRRSSGTSGEEDSASPGKFILTLLSVLSWCMACTAARAHCREKKHLLEMTAVCHREKEWD